MRTCTAVLLALVLPAGHGAAQEDETVFVKFAANEPITAYLNEKQVMRGIDFGFARARTRASNSLVIVHETSKVTAYRVAGTGVKVARPKNRSNRVDFDLGRVPDATRVIEIFIESEPTLFEGETPFTYRDLATTRTHRIPLSGELFDVLDLECREVTLDSRLSGTPFRAGFRKRWTHEIMLETSFCGTKSGTRTLRPNCCNKWSCASHSELCYVEQAIPTQAGTIRLRLSFPEMNLSVRRKDKDAMHLLPRRRGNLSIAIE